MRPLLALLLLTLLAACGEKPPQVTEIQVEANVVQPGVVCRVGRNGGPLHADRGIGGTGASFGDQLADRGIGGTGVVGVVTGFASVCVGGLEVRYEDHVSVDIDGTPASPAQLRVGQVVAIRAATPASGTSLPSFARTISVRTEIAGPIEAIEATRDAMTVAGQQVIVTKATWGSNRFGLGDWVSVSGLRQPDGAILASRLDDTTAGRLFLRGQVERRDGGLWIGGLRLTGAALASVRAGDVVAATGSYQSGIAQLTTAASDTLAVSPTTYFGATVSQIVIQAFVTVDGGVVWLNNRMKVPLVPSLRVEKPVSGDAIVTLDRRSDGTFLAVGLRYTTYPSAAELGLLSQVWHGRMLPVPPVPPANAPAADPAADAPDGAGAGPDESVPMAGDGMSATPRTPMSCATCGQPAQPPQVVLATFPGATATHGGKTVGHDARGSVRAGSIAGGSAHAGATRGHAGAHDIPPSVVVLPASATGATPGQEDAGHPPR